MANVKPSDPLVQRGFHLVTAAQDTALLQTAVAAAGAQLRAGLS
jgi:hypothetical protein